MSEMTNQQYKTVQTLTLAYWTIVNRCQELSVKYRKCLKEVDRATTIEAQERAKLEKVRLDSKMLTQVDVWVRFITALLPAIESLPILKGDQQRVQPENLATWWAGFESGDHAWQDPNVIDQFHVSMWDVDWMPFARIMVLNQLGIE